MQNNLEASFIFNLHVVSQCGQLQLKCDCKIYQDTATCTHSTLSKTPYAVAHQQWPSVLCSLVFIAMTRTKVIWEVGKRPFDEMPPLGCPVEKSVGHFLG